MIVHFLQSWMDLEAQLLAMEIAIPISFTYETQEILEIYEKLTSSGLSDKDGSAAAGKYMYLLLNDLHVCMCIYL